MASHERGLRDRRDSCCRWLSRHGPSQHSRREMVCRRMSCSWGSSRSAAPLHFQEIHPPDRPPDGGDDRIPSSQTHFTYCQTMRSLGRSGLAIGWSVGSTSMKMLIDASLVIRTETVCLRMSLSHAEAKPRFLKANWSFSRRPGKDGFTRTM